MLDSIVVNEHDVLRFLRLFAHAQIVSCFITGVANYRAIPFSCAIYIRFPFIYS